MPKTARFIYCSALQNKFDNAKIGIKCDIISTVIKECGNTMVTCMFPDIYAYRQLRNDFWAVTGRALIEE